MNQTLPYSEAFYPLLKSIHQAIGKCFELHKKNGLEFLSPENEEIISCFSNLNFYKQGINKHITEGFSKTHKKRYGRFPRLTKLTVQAYKEAQAITKKSNFKGIVIPSPLYILQMSLTIPSEPQTAAYAHLLCRSMLFFGTSLHPYNKEITPDDSQFSRFDENDVIDSLSSFRKYINIQARWPDQRERKNSGLASRLNFLVGNYLSMKGYAHFWFINESTLKTFIKANVDDNASWFLSKYKTPTYRFRISEAYIDLPEQGEIINSMFGIPLPFRGAEILFHGGLKKTFNSGVVVNVSGKPGVGKTSVALSLAAILSPFNTKTFYISLEEQPEDLYARFLTLIPEYLKESSIYKKPNGVDNTEWLTISRISENLNFEDLTELISLIQDEISSNKIKEKTDQITIPSVCPLYVVIDNINELAAGYVESTSNYDKIEKFILACRRLGALVFLISSEEIPAKIGLDYLVDISIHLKQPGTDNNLIKPIRIFQLSKTRHQISRQGSHVFHLSGSEGFRVCPQIPSQMDKKENIKRLLPNKNKCITTLNILEQDGKNPMYVPYINIFPNSQILVHGNGSAGKAGFGLKILLTPIIDRIKAHSKIQLDKEQSFLERQVFKTNFSDLTFQRKVLVISFLYPQEYYEELINERITPSLKRIYKGLRHPRFKLLPFFPGYLTAEDFINKIIRHLDEAILNGEPFTGVMLDGLHNVFLQFKNLQENDMIWPLLYGILSRYNVTVVSTFTNFRVNNHTDSDMSAYLIEDQKLMQKGQAPLLHSMVKASDFYIALEESRSISNMETIYTISIRSSIDQKPPNSLLEWDRQKLSIIDYPTKTS